MPLLLTVRRCLPSPVHSRGLAGSSAVFHDTSRLLRMLTEAIATFHKTVRCPSLPVEKDDQPFLAHISQSPQILENPFGKGSIGRRCEDRGRFPHIT
jgi:hypothetical protein